MSSDLLAKCLPCILSAIQSSLGLTLAYWGVKFHMFTRLTGDSEERREEEEEGREKGWGKKTLPARKMPNHYRCEDTYRNHWQCLLVATAMFVDCEPTIWQRMTWVCRWSDRMDVVRCCKRSSRRLTIMLMWSTSFYERGKKKKKKKTSQRPVKPARPVM